MIEHIARKIFFACVYPCATLVLFVIWNGGPDSGPLFESLFKIAASFFIVGLAGFLTWFVLCLSRIARAPGLFEKSLVG